MAVIKEKLAARSPGSFPVSESTARNPVRTLGLTPAQMSQGSTRPPTPVPWTESRSTPFSLASLRTIGVT